MLGLSRLLLTLVALVLISLGTAQASDALLYDDFESCAIGSPPSGWVQEPSPGPFLVTEEQRGDSSLRRHSPPRLGRTSATRSLTAAPQPEKALLFRPFPVQSSPLLVQFSVRLLPEAAFSFGLSLGSPSLPGNRAVQITFQKDRSVTHFDGEVEEAISRFRPSRRVKVALVADPSIAAFDLYLNGSKKTAAPLPFWNVSPQVDTLYLEIPAKAAAACFVDDVTVVPAPAPRAPTGLRTTAVRPSEVRLRWQPSPERNIIGYRVYRAGQLLAELPASQTSYTDGNLEPGTGYAYSLTALDGRLRRDESVPTWPVAVLTPTLKPLPQGAKNKYDVVIYGATPAGIAAALAAARLGSSVALVEPTSRLGGMMSGGLGRTDVRTRSLHGGIFREFVQKAEDYYSSAYGPQSRQVAHCSGGYYFEPGVARAIFAGMLSQQEGIETYFQHRLNSVRTRQLAGAPLTSPHHANAPAYSGSRPVAGALELDGGGRAADASLLSVTVEALATGEKKTLYARAFIDASYEADLAALAGVPYRVGREGKEEFNEEHAGEIFWDYRYYKVVGGSGKGDDRVQAYNYRLCLTKRPTNKAPIPRPKGYGPGTYATVLLDAQERHLRLSEILSFGRLPNDKCDVNNHGYARQSTDLPEANHDYPDGDAERRSQIALHIKDYILGLLYFLQNDARLPEQLRSEARQWGLAKDEFVDNGNFPPQLYIREARRIVGLYTFTENDARFDPSPYGEQSRTISRTPPKPDSVACGDYAMDSHATQRWNPETPDYYEGFFYLPAITKAYEIPYRILLPQSLQRLLVAFGVSATHIGFGTIRMEPVLMNLGQAAGTAAHLASQRHRWPKNVSVSRLQEILVENGQIIGF